MGKPDDTDPKILRQLRGLNVDPEAPIEAFVPRWGRELFERAAEAVDYPSAVTRLNKASELAADIAATNWVKRTYGPNAELVAVLKRQNGVPILDKVFKTGPKQYVLLETKSFLSELGLTNDHFYASKPDGTVIKVTLPADIEQFSPAWMDQRFDELRIGPTANAESRALAAALEESAKSGGLRPMVVRAMPKRRWWEGPRIEEAPTTTELVAEIVDHSDEFNAHHKVKSTHAIPKGSEVGSRNSGAVVSKGVSMPGRTAVERGLAIDVALAEAAHEEASDAFDAARENIESLRKQRDRAEGHLATAKRYQKKHPGSKKAPKDVQDRTDKLKALKADLERAKAELPATRERAQLAKARLKSKQEVARLASARRPRPRRVAPPPAGTPPIAERATLPQQTATSIKNPKEQHVRDTSVSTKAIALGAPLTAPKPPSVARRIGRFVMRGGKVLVQLGAKLLPILDIVDGMLMVVSAIDYIVAWVQRDKIADREEWTRIAHFLSWESKRTRLSPHDVEYVIGLGDVASQHVQSTLASERAGSFEHWFHKWETDKSWPGFVYATITVSLVRSELRAASITDPYLSPYSDESVRPAAPFSPAELERVKLLAPDYKMDVEEYRDYPVTYDLTSKMEVFPTHSPLPNQKRVIGVPVHKSALDEGNRRVPLRIREAGYQQGKSVDVEVTRLWVRYTYPTPILTPFDFIIAKANNLVAGLIAFVSTYDENVAPDQEVSIPVLGQAWNLFGGYEAPLPLQSLAIRSSLLAILAALQELGRHTTRDDDTELADPPSRHNKGLLRRQRILQALMKGDPGIERGARVRKSHVVSFEQIARLYLPRICSADSPGPIRTEDPEVDTLTVQTLCDFAWEIHADIIRAHARSKASLDLNYNGPSSSGQASVTSSSPDAQARVERQPRAARLPDGGVISDRERGLA